MDVESVAQPVEPPPEPAVASPPPPERAAPQQAPQERSSAPVPEDSARNIDLFA